MRGRTDLQGSVFYAINVEKLVPADHPLRGIRRLADEELKRLSPKFEAAYSKVGRPSDSRGENSVGGSDSTRQLLRGLSGG